MSTDDYTAWRDLPPDQRVRQNYIDIPNDRSCSMIVPQDELLEGFFLEIEHWSRPDVVVRTDIQDQRMQRMLQSLIVALLAARRGLAPISALGPPIPSQKEETT